MLDWMVKQVAAINEKIIFPVHPRTKLKLENKNYISENLLVIPPQGYLDFQSLIFNSKGVLTDSGEFRKKHISGKNRATHLELKLNGLKLSKLVEPSGYSW